MKDPQWLNRHREKVENESGRYLRRIRKRKPKGIDTLIRSLDEEVFSEINCLQCANCCKTISPVFRQRDISRLASYLGISESAFFSKYLMTDQDGDYILRSVPCSFLGDDNKCSVYESRPDACRGYPHTGTLPFTGNSELMIRNSAVCPAVYEIVERLKLNYP